MIFQLVRLEKYTTDENPLLLEDKVNNSYAEYLLNNPNRRGIQYVNTDSEHGPDPRCDYMVYIESCSIVKFIELKGVDKETRLPQCCRTTWEHGFHQLMETYSTYQGIIEPTDEVEFILCTSVLKKRCNARYKQYPKYKKLMKISKAIKILFKDEEEQI